VRTGVEGEWNDVTKVLKGCPIRTAESAPQASVLVVIDYGPVHRDGLRAMLEAVEKPLGRA
jgi:hypothetical protein